MAERDVLVVEDDLEVREALHQILISAGYNCRLANDGREGVEVFKAGQPALVVTGVTGVELLQQVRAVDDDVAVIVLTGVANLKTAIASLKLGAHAVLVKPINMDELLITVERALERRQLLIERRQHQQAHGQRQEAPREVLIVEHNPAHRDVFNQMFLFAGYTCLLSSDGDKGLEIFRKARPPLIVTEINMPAPLMVTEGNVPVTCGGEKIPGAGIGLLRLVRQEDPDAAVIVLGGMGDVKTHVACLKLGAYAHILKPVNMDELLIAAERALERRQLLIERRRRGDAQDV
jgi:DNA-binding NtrC family response regulator